MSLIEYRQFIASRGIAMDRQGFAPHDMTPHAKAHQRAVLDFALDRGKSAAFLDTGLGKSLIELEFARQCAAGDVTAFVSDTKIRLATDTIAITSKVIDGTFPDYTRVIPKGNHNRATIDAAELRGAVGRVVTVASERTSAVKMEFAADAVTVSHTSATGQAQDAVGAGYDGPELAIGINGKYLAELLGQVTGDAVFDMGGAGDPVIIRDSDDTGLLMICMPMRY